LPAITKDPVSLKIYLRPVKGPKLTSGVSTKPVPQSGTETRAKAEIEKNPRVHEEAACKKLAHLLQWNPPEQKVYVLDKVVQREYR
jgi:hypothetical protein